MSSTIKQAIEALKGRIADAYTAVSAKGGTLPATQDSANLPAAINSIPSGGGGVVEEKDINFIDHTGTIVASYTLAEALQLTELPAPIQYDGLTFIEWQFTLAEIQDFAQHNTFLNIGAYYKATDELLHLFVNIETDNTECSIYLYGAAWNSLETVDWGDGSTPTSVGRGTLSHIYNRGDYEIIVSSDLTKAGGMYSTSFPSARNTTAYCLYKIFASPYCTSVGGYPYAIREIVTNRSTSFTYPFSLLPNTIITPNLLGSGGGTVGSTKYICNRGISSAINYAYEGNIAARILPPIVEGATAVASRTYRDCMHLQRVVLPSTITSISAIFRYNYSLRDMYIYSTQIPTLSSAGAITGCESENLTIHVLSSLYSGYESDTNWAAVAADSKITLIGDL